MGKIKRVKMCLGKYGSKEEKDCRDDCFKCQEVKEEKEVIFCKNKKAFPCDIFCDDVNLCKAVYWKWWGKNRDKKCSLDEEIKNFMKENNLIFNKNKNDRYTRTNRKII